MMEVNTASSRVNDIMIMEVNNRTTRCTEKRPLEIPTPRNETKKNLENNESSTPVFINHVAIAWSEGRRQWIGERSKKPRQMPKDPIIRFPEPVPLPEMVDFLVDIWQDEGLFDYVVN
ncbi:hypothetical protein L6452_11758 [Arctium lappa]|uniref:Uncharacterized protein n=1 Tax=Arctium lappa TaxID=4217 RepID=A0ACB9DQV0_ARCLA|nr:hypothetical protein L6452_11758 [Arctium lappa]